MFIDLLGPVMINADGRRYSMANKVRNMLAALALEAGRAVSYDELADELWSEQPLGNTRNALQAHATRLRKVLETAAERPGAVPLVRAVWGGYMLDMQPSSVDSNRFLELAAQGSQALDRDPQRALERFRASLALWRGPALLNARDGFRCRGAAALLEERRLTVWEGLVKARMLLGDEAHAIAELQQLVAQHPLRETFCDLLMLALYRSGRQSDALELFRATRRRLVDELGVQPGLSLQRRHVEILSHDPALALSSAVQPGRAETTVAPR